MPSAGWEGRKFYFKSSGQLPLSLNHCYEQEQDIPHTHGGQDKTSPAHYAEVKINASLVAFTFLAVTQLLIQ